VQKFTFLKLLLKTLSFPVNFLSVPDFLQGAFKKRLKNNKSCFNNLHKLYQSCNILCFTPPEDAVYTYRLQRALFYAFTIIK
jgi:hypothetical protein